jgi:WhiB family transcriptional regulator, redox-sensing transcriptional regulator
LPVFTGWNPDFDGMKTSINREEADTMTSSEQGARLGPSDFLHLLTINGRLYETEAQTPCRVHTAVNEGRDLWFSPFRDREQAARMCQSCPFLGRCGYNAVVSRATHGVWGGEVLPGDKPVELEPIYARLLAQFEARRPIELGNAPAPSLPAASPRRRARSGVNAA